jgi:hypothetical protein
MIDFDFGDGTPEPHDVSTPQKDDKTNLNGDIILDNDTPANLDNVDKPDKKPADDSGQDGKDVKPESPIKHHDYEIGTVLEVDDASYTVDANGDAVDKDGKVFKTATEINDWIKSLTSVQDGISDDTMSISSLQELFDVEVTDENDKPIEFTDTKEGRQEYIKAVMDATREEAAEATIQTLYNKYPFLEQAIAYYVTNGNSLDGFGVVQDRSNLTIDPNNTEQQEAIIRSAWKEQGRKGDVDTYIQYLKSQNQLKDTAEEELAGLKEKDKETKETLAAAAEAEEKKRIEVERAYWNKAKSVIDSKVIAGYRIPDTIVIEKDGVKTSATPNDFFNYIYQIDKTTGTTRYENDLKAESPEKRLNDELLAAYIKFSGGTYNSLVNMAIHDKNIKTLKLTAKKATVTKATVKPPVKGDTKNVDFGF